MPARPRSLLVSIVVPLLAASPSAARASGTEPGAAPAGAAAGALVRRCVEAYGGKAALARLATQRQRGTVTSRVLHGGATGRIVRAYARSGRLRVEIAYPGQPAEVRVLDGGRGWRFGEEVSGPFLGSMVLQAARLDLPALLAAWEGKLDDLGTLELDGKPLRVLAMQVAPGLVVEAAIDPATGRILRSRGTSRGGAMPLEFTTTYSDFRKVGGVLVAFREGNFANGQTTGETVLESVEFPASLPEETFRP